MRSNNRMGPKGAVEGTSAAGASTTVGSGWSDVGTISDGAAWPSGAAGDDEVVSCGTSGAGGAGTWEASKVIRAGAIPVGGSTLVFEHS
jgi:hypothetical protein